MKYETILYEKKNGVLKITLNRPDVLNAFNEQLSYDLISAFEAATADSEVRVVVLTGAGRAFCSGQDLKDISDDPDRSLGDSLKTRYNPLIRLIRSIPKPVIAAINGASRRHRVRSTSGSAVMPWSDTTITVVRSRSRRDSTRPRARSAVR